MKHDSGPMACDSARLQASAWIDGEWPASSVLVAHLEGCDECRGHVETLRALSARLAGLRAAEPEADLWPSIAARARAAARRPQQGIQRARRIAAALIGCAITAALLEAASLLLTQATRGNAVAQRAAWPAALHQESNAFRELSSAPEQRLLASIDPAGK